MILGGRLGYVIVLRHDVLGGRSAGILKIWDGGMSFHGGLARRDDRARDFCRAPQARDRGRVSISRRRCPGIGLFAGRIGNFINGELWGKPTDVPWGFIVDGEVRHASQLYEAGARRPAAVHHPVVYTAKPRPRLAPAGLFLVCYGVFDSPSSSCACRTSIWASWLSCVRLAHHGQMLTLPMLLIGVTLLSWPTGRNQPSASLATADYR